MKNFSLRQSMTSEFGQMAALETGKPLHSFTFHSARCVTIMKAAAVWAVLAAYLASTYGLRCMTCYGSGSVDDCDASGFIKQCMPNEKSCETTVRRSGDHITVMKGCKTSRACKDNQMQNTRYSGRSTQCNSDQDNSVCTCCCNKDMCNVGVSTCKLNYPQVIYDETDCSAVPPIFPHGDVKCNGNKVCEYECTEKDYFVWPKESKINVCLSNGSWARESPCCDRPCPPYMIADNMMLIHHTGTSAKQFLQQLPQGLTYAPIAEDALKISVMSFGDDIVESSVVKFNEYDANATLLVQLLRERQVIAGEGVGDTGLAMQYALDNLLQPEAGMRTNSKVMKTLELHTNTQPNDNAIEVGKKARERGFLVYIFGFEVDGFKFDRKQLTEITGDKDHVFIFQGYYADLTPENQKDLDDHFCPKPCDHILHNE